jgi:hypothetical protein
MRVLTRPEPALGHRHDPKCESLLTLPVLGLCLADKPNHIRRHAATSKPGRWQQTRSLPARDQHTPSPRLEECNSATVE